jgi:hypothetical protein
VAHDVRQRLLHHPVDDRARVVVDPVQVGDQLDGQAARADPVDQVGNVLLGLSGVDGVQHATQLGE